MKKKLLALSLIFAMSVAPMTALAAEDKVVSETSKVNNSETVTGGETEKPTETLDDEKPTQTGAPINEPKEETKLFADVTNDVWYADAVDFVTKRGIMSGTSETAYSPNEPATRGMLALIMKNMDGTNEKVYWSYLDVDEDAWYADAVAWCSENNIMKGYGGGMFGPDDSITREQLVSVMYSFAKYKNFGNMETNGIELLDYKDYADISGYAGGPMQWALKNNLISGKEGNILDPKGVATRAEIAQVIRNFMVFYNI